jgi:hypothetical protein
MKRLLALLMFALAALTSCITVPLPRDTGFLLEKPSADAVFGLPEVQVNSLSAKAFEGEFLVSLARQAAIESGINVQVAGATHSVKLFIEEHPFNLGLERYQSVSCLLVVSRIEGPGLARRIGQTLYSEDCLVPLDSANRIFGLMERAFGRLAALGR